MSIDDDSLTLPASLKSDRSPSPEVSIEGLAEESVLAAAFESVRRNGEAAGVDGVSVDAFAASFDSELKRVQSELLTGSYRPQAVRAFELPKPAGGTRILGIPVTNDLSLYSALRDPGPADS